MSDSRRIALLHTGAVVIGPAMEHVARELPGFVAINYLDDRIVADLRDEDRRASVQGRLVHVARAAADAGAEAVLLTCSSISEFAAPVSAEVGIPVLRVDEAMADEAVSLGRNIVVLATLATTCAPTGRLILERAERAGVTAQVQDTVIEGAFEAVVSGDRATHDRLVSEAIEKAAQHADVIVLAQASMASAAEAVTVDVPVLTSLARGVERLREFVSA